MSDDGKDQLTRAYDAETEEERDALLIEAAKKGNKTAVGHCFLHGLNGQRADPDKAVALFRLQAEKDDGLAMYALAGCYGMGLGVEADEDKSMLWMLSAARGGVVAAMGDTAVCYAEGQGVDQDWNKAVEWFTKASDAGDVDATYNLAVAYADGMGLDADAKRAAALYRKAAEGGHPGAMFNLGVSLGEGEGVEKDENAAVEWFTKASDKGDMGAAATLGYIFLKGSHGQKCDLAKAYKYTLLAAEAGNETATGNLGEMYLGGLGVDKDVEKGADLLLQGEEEHEEQFQALDEAVRHAALIRQASHEAFKVCTVEDDSDDSELAEALAAAAGDGSDSDSADSSDEVLEFDGTEKVSDDEGPRPSKRSKRA